MSGRSHRRNRGFTLIELLVVMVIIGTLLSIAAPRYFRSLERTKETVLAQDLSVLRTAIDQFYADRGQYPQSIEELAIERYVRAIPVDPMTRSAETWLIVSSSDRDMPGIIDIRSGSDRIASDGTAYNEW